MTDQIKWLDFGQSKAGSFPPVYSLNSKPSEPVSNFWAKVNEHNFQDVKVKKKLYDRSSKSGTIAYTDTEISIH